VLDEIFGEAWVNSTHRVLGKKLLPFSLWHRFQLLLLDSPFLENQIPQPIQLEQAVRACRLVYPNTIDAKIRPWSFRWRLAGRNYLNECLAFDAYMRDYYSIPEFLPSTKKYHQTEINHPPPEEMRIFSAVATMTGWSEEKIWNMPIGQAYWYAAGHWYQAGRELDFLTPEHLVLKKRIEAMKAEKEEEKK
jgi:hypothetical protein